MTVDAVSDLDLSYTPPLGSPWDAVQMAAQAWVRETRPRSTAPDLSAEEHPMSGHYARPGPQPRRTIHPVIWSAAAIILLTLPACTSTSTSSTGIGGGRGQHRLSRP